VADRGPLADRDALECVLGVAAALSAAESKRIIHRDINPDNCLVTPEGYAKVMDLGLAKTPGESQLTQPGVVLGSPSYVAPEQVEGAPDLDIRADLYSLGLVLWFLVTGRTPFGTGEFAEVAGRRLHEDVPDPRTVRPEAGEPVAALIAGLTARDRAARYPTAGAARADVERALAGQRLAGPGAHPGAAPKRNAFRSPRIATLGGAAPETGRVGRQARPACPPFTLRVFDRKQGGAEVVVGTFERPEVSIGRSADVDLRIEDNTVSRRHATITRKGADEFVLDPVSSTNSTVVNGQEVDRPGTVSSRDEVVLSYRFVLQVEVSPRAAKPPVGEPDTEPQGIPRPTPGGELRRRPGAPGRGPARPPASAGHRRPPPRRARPSARRRPPPPSGRRPPPARRRPSPTPAEPPSPYEAPPDSSAAGAPPSPHEAPADSSATGASPSPYEALAAPPAPAAEAPSAPRAEPPSARAGKPRFVPTVGPEPPDPATVPPDVLAELLRDARRRGASDLHFVAGAPPLLRVDGALVPAEAEVLHAGELEALVHQAVSGETRAAFLESGDVDLCVEIDGLRYRTNLCRQRTGASLTFRVIAERIQPPEELGLPSAARRLTEFAQGLVLVSGPLGAGKTTTMLSLVDLINRSRPEHIVTIEDPIELLVPPARCQVSQRELGAHTRSFARALRAALREDPDVIMIGDLRDRETAALAISAAETGHLVFASVPAVSAIKTVDKLIDMFPADEQATTRTMVSESLRGVLWQRLLPARGGGRVAAVELLLNSVAVANLIRDGKSSGIENAMQLGRSRGMQTLGFALDELLAAERIDPEVAEAAKER